MSLIYSLLKVDGRFYTEKRGLSTLLACYCYRHQDRAGGVAIETGVPISHGSLIGQKKNKSNWYETVTNLKCQRKLG